MKIKLTGLLLALSLLHGCGGSDPLPADIDVTDQLGAIQLSFNADGTQPRFDEGTNYEVVLFLANTDSKVERSAFFDRGPDNLQMATIDGVAPGTYDLIVDALDPDGEIVGSAIAEDVIVTPGDTTLVNNTDLVFAP